MPNQMPYGFPNPNNPFMNDFYNMPNDNKINELEQRIYNLEQRVKSLEDKQTGSKKFDYQTSMNMM